MNGNSYNYARQDHRSEWVGTPKHPTKLWILWSRRTTTNDYPTAGIETTKSQGQVQQECAMEREEDKQEGNPRWYETLDTSNQGTTKMAATNGWPTVVQSVLATAPSECSPKERQDRLQGEQLQVVTWWPGCLQEDRRRRLCRDKCSQKYPVSAWDHRPRSALWNMEVHQSRCQQWYHKYTFLDDKGLIVRFWSNEWD